MGISNSKQPIFSAHYKNSANSRIAHLRIKIGSWLKINRPYIDNYDENPLRQNFKTLYRFKWRRGSILFFEYIGQDGNKLGLKKT